MTAEKVDHGIGESSGASCSTECSSTTPHLGTNESNTGCQEQHVGDGRNSAKKNSLNDNEDEKFTSSSSMVLLKLIELYVSYIYI